MSVKKNFIYNVMYQVLLIILPLVTAPYLSRVLGAGQLGEYSYTYSVANYFVLFAMLGVNNYGNRCIARCKNNKKERSSVFYSIFSLQALLTIFACLIYLAYSVYLSENFMLAAIWTPYIISAGLDVNWFFFGMEEFRLTVTRNFVVKLTSFILTLLLVRGEHALAIYCSLMSISYLISAAVLWPFVRQRVEWVRPTLKSIISHLLPNLTLFIPVVAVSLYTVMDKVMLGWLSSFEENGYFENAFKVATMPTTVITALGTVMLPRVTSLLADGNRVEAHRYLGQSMWLALVMAFAFSFGVAGVAPILVPVLFGPGFGPSEAAMCVIVADMPFMAWANVLRTQLLIPEGRDKDYVLSVVAGAAVNVVINLLLVPSMGALGAAVGTFCAETSVCVVQTCAVRREIPLRQWMRKALPYVVIGLMMFVAVRLFGDAAGASPMTLLLQVIFGAAVYAALSAVWCKMTHDKDFEQIILPTLNQLLIKVGINRGSNVG